MESSLTSVQCEKENFECNVHADFQSMDPEAACSTPPPQIGSELVPTDTKTLESWIDQKRQLWNEWTQLQQLNKNTDGWLSISSLLEKYKSLVDGLISQLSDETKPSLSCLQHFQQVTDSLCAKCKSQVQSVVDCKTCSRYVSQPIIACRPVPSAQCSACQNEASSGHGSIKAINCNGNMDRTFVCRNAIAVGCSPGTRSDGLCSCPTLTGFVSAKNGTCRSLPAAEFSSNGRAADEDDDDDGDRCRCAGVAAFGECKDNRFSEESSAAACSKDSSCGGDAAARRANDTSICSSDCSVHHVQSKNRKNSSEVVVELTVRKTAASDSSCADDEQSTESMEASAVPAAAAAAAVDAAITSSNCDLETKPTVVDLNPVDSTQPESCNGTSTDDKNFAAAAATAAAAPNVTSSANCGSGVVVSSARNGLKLSGCKETVRLAAAASSAEDADDVCKFRDTDSPTGGNTVLQRQSKACALSSEIEHDSTAESKLLLNLSSESRRDTNEEPIDQRVLDLKVADVSRDEGCSFALNLSKCDRQASKADSGSDAGVELTTEKRIAMILSEAQRAMQQQQQQQTVLATSNCKELLSSSVSPVASLKSPTAATAATVAAVPPNAADSDSRTAASSRSKRHRRRIVPCSAVTSSGSVLRSSRSPTSSSNYATRSGRKPVPGVLQSAGDVVASSASAGTTAAPSPARDLVARIYEDELRKLLAAAELHGNATDAAMYSRELAKLANLKAGCSSAPSSSSSGARLPLSASDGVTSDNNKENCDSNSTCHLLASRDDDDSDLSNDLPQDLSMSRTSTDRLDRQQLCLSTTTTTTSETTVGSSGVGLLEDDSSTVSMSPAVAADGLSPLQRMQCIANSLPLAPSAGHMSFNSQPARPQLPPITSEQLAACEDINTEELVGKIKDVLSQFSISQRLFGEAILGLSQGSVSDLLARPKPWPLLTQKGREPFIRMQAFLDDPEAISKLVATQYRVPADKLLRSNSTDATASPAMSTTTSASPLPPLPPPPTTSSVMLTNFTQIASPVCGTTSKPCDLTFPGPGHVVRDTATAAAAATGGTCFSTPAGIIPIAGCTAPVMGGNVGGGVMSMGATVFPFLPVASYIHTAPGHMAPVMMAVDFRPFFGQQHQQHQLPPVSNAMPLALTTNKAEPQQPSTTTTTTTTGADVGGASLTPSLLNCSSTDEIDTQELTASVRDVLQAHGLGQKLFGEAVLELSQGSVSELLAKPKPWALLSAKGREPFLRMRSWLNDPQGIDRLRAYQSQACLVNKRKLSPDSGSDSASGNGVGTPQKKPRLFFTEEQKMALRKAYAADPYPNQVAIEQLAASVGVGVKTVVNWFHNHRMRAKQLTAPGAGSGSVDSVLTFSSTMPVSPASTHTLNSSASSSLKVEEESCDRAATRVKVSTPHSSSTSVFCADPGIGFSSLSPASAAANVAAAGAGSPSCHGADSRSVQGPSGLAAGINKRKRARPHKVSEAIARFDQSNSRSISLMSEDSLPPCVEAPIDLSVLRGSTPQTGHGLEVDSTDVDVMGETESPPDAAAAADGDVSPSSLEQGKTEREKNIERLQKNLHQEPTDDWEF